MEIGQNLVLQGDEQKATRRICPKSNGLMAQKPGRLTGQSGICWFFWMQKFHEMQKFPQLAGEISGFGSPYIQHIPLWLVVSNMNFMTVHFIYGMSSFPLTNSYVSRWLLHHQAENEGQAPAAGQPLDRSPGLFTDVCLERDGGVISIPN